MTDDEWQMTNSRGDTPVPYSAGEAALWDIEAHGLAVQETGEPPVCDLEERTARFGEQLILFVKRIPRGPVARVPAPLLGLYHYAWFVGFGVAFVAYLALRKLAPNG